MTRDRTAEELGHEAVELLQALIRNKCVNDGTTDSGHETRSIDTIEDFLGSPGRRFSTVPGRESVVYRIEGKDPTAPTVALMGHVDVVPVNEDGWANDPFGAEIIDGFVWGRGAVDMLNVTAGMATVFRAFLSGDRAPPGGNLLFMALADEEAGGVHGAAPLVETAPEVVDCDFMLTEIAYPSLPTRSGRVYPIKVGEKGPAWRKLRSHGVPGHGSQPYGTNNALVRLTRAVTRLGQEASPVVIAPEWEAFVGGLDLPPGMSAALVDPDQIDAAIEDLATEDLGWARYVHACTHLTLSPNILASGGKANVIPDYGEADVDVRVVPGQEMTAVDDHLRKVLGPDYEELDIETVLEHPPSTSPAHGVFWTAMVDALESLTGSRAVVPALTPAATDARFFRSGGTHAYGVGVFDDGVEFSEFLGMFHGNDERVSVDSVGKTALLYQRIIERFNELSST